MKVVFKRIFDISTNRNKGKHQYLVYDLNFNASRYSFHREIDEQSDYIGRYYEELYGSEEYYKVVMKEADLIHKFISERQPEKFIKHSFEYFEFDLIKHNLKEALLAAGYNVESSLASSSIYVFLNGKKLRISNHKRPSYRPEDYIDFLDHEYDKEIISETNLFTRKQLHEGGLTRLTEDKYFLE